MTGTADNGGEDGAWCVVTGETSLAHTGSIIDNKSGYFVIHHFLGF
jgi:hypothetical protein